MGLTGISLTAITGLMKRRSCRIFYTVFVIICLFATSSGELKIFNIPREKFSYSIQLNFLALTLGIATAQ